MSVAPIPIRVLRHETAWRIQYGEVVLEYATRGQAVAAAIERARRLASDGQLVAVVMDVITSLYGPSGFIRTVPSRKGSIPLAPMPVDEYKALLASPGTSAAPPRRLVTSVTSRAMQQPTASAVAKTPRLLQIADRFERDRPDR